MVSYQEKPTYTNEAAPMGQVYILFLGLSFELLSIPDPLLHIRVLFGTVTCFHLLLSLSS